MEGSIGFPTVGPFPCMTPLPDEDTMTLPVSCTIRGLKLTLLLELSEVLAEVATGPLSVTTDSLSYVDQVLVLGLKALVGDLRFLTNSCLS
jgi:hypothetical protein